MPNIVLTYRCNLSCKYCFANEFVNSTTNNISFDNFKKALDFVTGGRSIRLVGIIGGEPLLHPEFSKILLYTLNNKFIRNVRVFTNGIELHKFMEELSHRRVSLLINCNAPKDIGEAQFNRLVDNLDIAIKRFGMQEKISLGINLYDPQMDYEYIIYLLKRYDYHYLRTVVAVPNYKQKVNSLDYFSRFKDYTLKFFSDLKKINVVPSYDCNTVPICIYNDQELESIRSTLSSIKYINKDGIEFKSNILSGDTCQPVVDILPDLTAIRCFGLSEYSKVNISDFDTLESLIKYYENQFDIYKYNTSACQQCWNCKEQIEHHCSGGCLSFKIQNIIKLRQFSESLAKKAPQANIASSRL